MKTKKKPNWKTIALQLGQRVNFAISHLKSNGGSEIIIDTSTYDTRHWKEYFADAMELIPGIKVDREAMYAVSLPKRQRNAFFAKRKKQTNESTHGHRKARSPDRNHAN